MKPPYNIDIEFLDVGATVRVGCKQIAYADLQQMLIDLSAYVNNPAETIKLMQEEHPGLREEPRRYRTGGITDHTADALRYADAGMIGMPSGQVYPETGN